MVHLQALPHDRFVVVGALHHPAAAAPAGGSAVADRRVGAAALANHPCRQPPHQLRFGDDHVDHDQRIASGHEAVELGRLGDGAREPVEHEAADHVLAVEPLAHDPDHHLVADQLTAIHDLFRPQSNLGAGVHRLAQDVAGRYLRDPARARKPLCLRSLTGAGRAEHQQVQSHMVTRACGLRVST